MSHRLQMYLFSHFGRGLSALHRLAIGVVALSFIVVPASADNSDGRKRDGQEVSIGTIEVPATAAQRFDIAVASYESGDIRTAQHQFEQIVADYSDTRHARQARRYLAKIYQNIEAPEGPGGEAALETGSGTGPWNTQVSTDDNLRTVANPKSARTSAKEVRKHLDERASEELRFAAGDRVFFGADSADLGSRARSVLRRQASWLAANDVYHILLEGHADDSGGKVINQSLSAKRASIVRARLIEEGVAADRIFVEGLGETNPVAPCSSKACAAQNRRVVTLVLGLSKQANPRLGNVESHRRSGPQAGLGQAMWLRGPK